MTSTPEPTLTACELELRRRLGDLGARANVDDAACDRIQAGIDPRHHSWHVVAEQGAVVTGRPPAQVTDHRDHMDRVG